LGSTAVQDLNLFVGQLTSQSLAQKIGEQIGVAVDKTTAFALNRGEERRPW
jgi:hypothetical protein